MKPTTSPRRTWKVDPLHTSRSPELGCCTVQSRTSKKTSPMSGVWSGNRLLSSRPTMPRTMRSSLTPSALTSSVSMVRPSRRIVMLSAIASISPSLCEMMIEVMPCCRKPRSRSSRCRESSSLRAAVGSSRMSSFTSFANALAISTSCCLPTPMSLISVSGSSRSPTCSISSSARRREAFQSIAPRLRGSLPRKMFSAIDMPGTSASSWWMITIPACSLARMSWNRICSPR